MLLPRTLLAAFLVAAMQAPAVLAEQQPAHVLHADAFRHYVDAFNQNDAELYTQVYANTNAWEFLKANIPLLDCPDKEIEQTYYFRWWTFRKHIKQTPEGFVITEFLPQVPWSGKYNAICCPAGHHFYEGRWLHEPKFLNDYAAFWFRPGSNPRSYSFWAADALYAYYLVRHDASLVTGLLDDLVRNYQAWERSHLMTDGLFWQIDDRDGMEVSIGKSGKRATINSYIYGDAQAIARIARLAGKPKRAVEYEKKAARLRQVVEDKLWDPQAKFFKTLPRSEYELVAPRNSSDGSVPSHVWNDKEHQGTLEWLQYDFPSPVRAGAVEVYWRSDGGGLALPQSWRVLSRQGQAWKPGENTGPYAVEPDKYDRMDFRPVETDALRLEIQSKPGKGAGVFEWRVLSGAENIAPLAKASSSAERTNRRFGNTLRTLNDGENKSREATLVDVRELHGFTPWYFHLPENGKGYEVAWKQLLDPQGFLAPFGPTTAEQRHPGFKISYEGHYCQWNGPSWPFATAVTLTALANVLNDYPQDAIDKAGYFQTLKTYAHSQHRTLKDGRVVPWIDENLNPLTGDWIARTCCEQRNEVLLQRGQVDKILRERGKDYNHSTFCDLVITGLVGLRPRADDMVEVNPLIPYGTWDYFCLDNISYHGRTITILWDTTGSKYGKGKGLQVWADGRKIAQSDVLGRVSGRIAPPAVEGK